MFNKIIVLLIVISNLFKYVLTQEIEVHTSGHNHHKPLFKHNTAISEIKAHNDVTRNKISLWITDDDWKSPPSLFNYGLPAFAKDYVSKPVGDVIIQHDFISFLGLKLEHQFMRPISYLEIGVSVGKSLFTQVNFFHKDTKIYAFDIEDANPTLAFQFKKHEIVKSWTDENLFSGVTTTRRTEVAKTYGHDKDSITVFSESGPNHPPLNYLACDEFNEVGWLELKKSQPKFNLIFSDALHSDKAILYEWNKLVSLELIDTQNFAIIWDDCDNQIRTQVKIIALKGIGTAFTCSAILKIYGWLGINLDGEHSTCIFTSLDLRKYSDVVAFPAIEAINCTSI